MVCRDARHVETIEMDWRRRARASLDTGSRQVEDHCDRLSELREDGSFGPRHQGVASYTTCASLFLAAGLNPVVEAIVRRGVRRSYAVLIVIVWVVIGIALFVMAIGPVICDQVISISDIAPTWLDQIQRSASELS